MLRRQLFGPCALRDFFQERPGYDHRGVWIAKVVTIRGLTSAGEAGRQLAARGVARGDLCCDSCRERWVFITTPKRSVG